MKQHTSKLFVISPFSHLERFLSKRYGPDVLFMTRMAGSWDDEDPELQETLQQLIVRERITEIYVVGDAACPLMGQLYQNKVPIHVGSSDLRRFFQTAGPTSRYGSGPGIEDVVQHIHHQLHKMKRGLSGRFPLKTSGLRIHGLLVNMDADSCQLIA